MHWLDLPLPVVWDRFCVWMVKPRSLRKKRPMPDFDKLYSTTWKLRKKAVVDDSIFKPTKFQVGVSGGKMTATECAARLSEEDAYDKTFGKEGGMATGSDWVWYTTCGGSPKLHTVPFDEMYMGSETEERREEEREEELCLCSKNLWS